MHKGNKARKIKIRDEHVNPAQRYRQEAKSALDQNTSEIKMMKRRESEPLDTKIKEQKRFAVKRPTHAAVERPTI